MDLAPVAIFREYNHANHGPALPYKTRAVRNSLLAGRWRNGRGRDLRLGRDVAIKVLGSGFASNAGALERFQREARAISTLNHPSVCMLFDIGCQGSTHFIVMELLEGQTLKEVIASPPLS